MRMRLTLAAVIVAASSLCGWAVTDAARQRVRGLRVLVDDLRALRLQMVSMFEPVQECLRRASSPLLRQVGDGMAEGTSAGDAWRRLSRSPRRVAPLAPEDREALGRMFAELGESGRERQEQLISGTAERMDELLENAVERARRAEKLYGSLGLLLGLLAALMVI